MTEHDVVLHDLAPSDVQADQVQGGAPLQVDLLPLAKVTVSLPLLGLFV